MSRFTVGVERWDDAALDAGETDDTDLQDGLSLYDALGLVRQALRGGDGCQVYGLLHGVTYDSTDLRTGVRVSATIYWPASTSRASKKRILNCLR